MDMYRSGVAVDVHTKLEAWAEQRSEYCRSAGAAYDDKARRYRANEKNNNKSDNIAEAMRFEFEPHGSMENQYLEARAEANSFETELKTSMTRKDFPQLLQARAAQEPKEAVCDAMFFVPIREALNSSNGFVSCTNEQEAMIANLKASNATTAPQQVTPPIAEAHNPLRVKLSSTTKAVGNSAASMGTPESSASKHTLNSQLAFPVAVASNQTKCSRWTSLANPTHTSSSTSMLPEESPEELCKADRPPLLLPDLIVEYKKPAHTEMKAVNQCRSYLASSVTYLASVGITEHRVFGLVTDGCKGGVMMAWLSTDGVRIICSLWYSK